jgi:hypothetical protein
MGLALRHIGIIIGNETYRYFMHKCGSRVLMILGASVIFNQVIFFYLVREGAYLDVGSVYCAIFIPYFFAGIGTVYLEQGFFFYMGYDDMLIPMDDSYKNADDFFGHPIYKIRWHCEQLIRFCSFLGALIAYQITPGFTTNQGRSGTGDMLFYLMPNLTLAGLMLLTVAPKPRYLTVQDASPEIRGHEATRKYKYEGYRTGRFWRQIYLMVTSIFKVDTLVLFGFIVS